jgi:hypothetical protein
MHSDSNVPRGFGGLVSLISAPPAPSAPPRRTIVSTPLLSSSGSEYSRSPTDADLPKGPSSQSFRMITRAVVAFGLAFVAFGIMLAVQPSISPQQEPMRPNVPPNGNTVPLRQASEPHTRVSPDPVHPDPNSFHYATQASPLDDPLREIPPPRGVNRVLDASEIDYCLSEGIRVDTMRSLINSRSNVQVRNFKLRSSNFKLRCASFRYRDGDMDRVKKFVDTRRSQLVLEAASVVSRWR